MDKAITMMWWLEPPEEIPAGEDARIEWLYAWWSRIDGWIADNRVAPIS